VAEKHIPPPSPSLNSEDSIRLSDWIASHPDRATGLSLSQVADFLKIEERTLRDRRKKRLFDGLIRFEKLGKKVLCFPYN
jgi:AraC-like DNA-binding protein